MQSYLVYVNLTGYSYGGVYKDKGIDNPTEMPYQFVQDLTPVLPAQHSHPSVGGESAMEFQINWKEKRTHEIFIPKGTGRFYVLLSITRKSRGHYNFLMDAQIRYVDFR